MTIHMSNRTHRILWAAWAGLSLASFAALEFIAINDDEEELEPTRDYLTWQVRALLYKYPPLWFVAAGVLSWLSYHFLHPTVPWTRLPPVYEKERRWKNSSEAL